MNRTRKLLMSVAASVLLAGSSAANSRLLEERASTRNSETLDQDPKQEEAEETITRILTAAVKDQPGDAKEHAMTIDEILAKDSSLDSETTKAALKDMIRDGLVRKTGDGTQDKPFRYYLRPGAEG